MTDEGRAGVEEIRQDYHDPNPRGRRPCQFFTTFVQRKLASGHPAAFTLAVLPHDPAQGSPATIADRIAFEPGSDDSVQVTIAGEGGTPGIKVDFRADGWSVIRRPSR
jgi:hypothetical protein